MRTHLLVALLLLGVGATPSQAQTPATDPQLAEAFDALRGCSELTGRNDIPGAVALGRRAESLLEARLARQPRDVEAIVALARAVTQCILPGADMMGQGELSTRSIELLENALAIDPTHWTARFVLASIHFRSPAFLGRAPRAAAEFDILLRAQGERVDNPRFARVFEYRGVLYTRANQADSARAVWTKGARLFPADSILKGLVERAGGASPSGQAARKIDAVRVVASAVTPPMQASEQRIDKGRILLTPGGAADVMQAVQMQPGATQVREGSDIYSRGGDPAETALLVDGARVATVSRFEGLNGSMFGAIEPFVVRAVRFSSGGFSVRHGNALSGVVEIETDGRPRERQMRAGLSLVQMSGTARLPVSKRAGAWVSSRASHTGALLATHGRSSEFVGAPHSEEAIASLIANPSPTSELRATAMVTRDDARQLVDAAGWVGPFHSAGGARALMLSSRWIAPSAPVTVRTSVVAGSRTSDFDFGVLSRARLERNETARADVEWAPADAIVLRGGVEQGAFTRREHGAIPTTSSVAPGAGERTISDDDAANQVGSFAEVQLARGRTALTAGLRADRLPGESATTLDPRIAIAVHHGTWIARAAAGVFHQGRWRAQPNIPDAGTPSGLAGSAGHLVLGVERDDPRVHIRAEAFAKRYADYSAFGAGPRVDGGLARGVDVYAQRKGSGRYTGFVGYSYLDASLRLADGRTARSPFDVTHSVTASATASLSADWSVGSTARYGTGAPHTAITGGVSQADGRGAPVYGALMGERLASYVRTDARVMRYVRTPRVLITSFAEVLNVFNRRNVSALTYDASYSNARPVRSFFASRTVVAGGELQFR